MNVTAISSLPAALAAASSEGNQLPILPQWTELIFGFIAIAILYVVVARKVVPNLERAYAARTAAIEGGMQRAEAAQREAQEALQHYRAQLAEARGEAAKIRQDAQEQGAAIIVDLRRQAQIEAERITETSKRQIEAERQQALISLRSDVGRISTDLAGRIVGESLQDQVRQSNVIDRFLAELESGSISPQKVAAGAATGATVADAGGGQGR